MASSAFPNTRWSLILPRNSPPELAERATDELCQLYWRPVYVYILSSGAGVRSPQEAEDLTQGFFLSLIQREFFQNADPAKGRLRSYLLGAVKHYLQTARRNEEAMKRGGGISFVCMDAADENEQVLSRLSTDGLSPDEQFDRRWAECLLEASLLRLREQYAARGRESHYCALRPLLAADEHDRPGLQVEAAAKLGLTSGTLRVAYHRFLERYREILAAEVRATLLPGMDAGEEFAYLGRLLRARRA